MSNHSFDIHVAEEYKSVEIAILVWHFHYWISKNKRLNKNFIDGHTWSYQTIQEIASVFPYWSVKQVERLLNKAVELQILIKGNFNKAAFDRTVWYAFNDEEKFGISRIREMEIPESGNPKDEIGKPIPDTLPNTLTNKKRERAPQAPPARSSPFIERAKHVATTFEEHHKLVNEYGESKTQTFYEILSTWKEDTPRSRWKKNDYRSILRWVVTAEEERNPKKENTISRREREDQRLAERVWDRFKGRPQQDISLSAKYIEFICGVNAPSTVLEFGTKDFRNRCLDQLQKRRLPLEGL